MRGTDEGKRNSEIFQHADGQRGRRIVCYVVFINTKILQLGAVSSLVGFICLILANVCFVWLVSWFCLFLWFHFVIFRFMVIWFYGLYLYGFRVVLWFHGMFYPYKYLFLMVGFMVLLFHVCMVSGFL